MLALVANPRLLGYLAVISLILGSGWWLYNNGYQSGVSDTVSVYEEKMKEERERISIANQAALDQSARRQAILLETIRSRNDEIEELRMEAEADPSANDGALSADSVRRINQID